MKPDEIKDLRKEKKLTQEQLGELCGVGKSAVSHWESGKDNPSGPSLKILQQLRDGDLVVSEISDLEMKLLDQNVLAGAFKSREDYLTASLKHLLVHGGFMSIQGKTPPSNITPLPKKKANLMAAAGSSIDAEVLDWGMGSDTVSVQIVGDSMSPKFSDGDVIDMRHRDGARSPFMKKGLIYLVHYDGGYMVKRYNTRKARADEKDADYLTPNGTVGRLESINPGFPTLDITGPCKWDAWFDEE